MRYYAPNQSQYVSQHVALPLEYLQANLDKRQKAFDDEIARMEAEGKLPYINSLNPDTQRLRDKEKYFKENIDKLTNDLLSTGNISQISPKLLQLKREKESYYAPTGEGGAIAGNYATRADFYKRQKDRLDKGDITQQDLENAMRSFDAEYQGIGDGKSGVYNQYRTEDLAKYINEDEYLDSLKNKYEADMVSSGNWKKGNDGYLYKNSGKNERVTYDEVMQGVLGAAFRNKELINYKAQSAKFAGQKFDMNPYVEKEVVGKDGKKTVVKSYNYDNPLVAAADRIAKRESFNRTETDEDIKEDGKWMEDYKQRKQAWSLANEGVITPGEKFDFKAGADNTKFLEAQLATLPPEGSFMDNNETKSTREFLKRRITIAKNYQNTLTTGYFNTEEGRKNFDKVWNEAKEGDSFGSKTALGKFLEDPEVKKHIKSKEDLQAYISGNLKLPASVENKKFDFSSGVSLAGASGGGGMGSSAVSLKDYFGTKFSGEITEYAKKNPVSYSARVLTGNDASSIGKVNKALTQRVMENGTNYIMSDGTDLDQYRNAITDAEGKPVKLDIHVAAVDDDINGQFGHYVTIKDDKGKVIKQDYIFPKTNAREEQDMIGRMLVEENIGFNDEQGKSNVKTGVYMRANSAYGDAIDDGYIKSFEYKLENKMKKSGRTTDDEFVPDINIPLPGGKVFNGGIQIVKDGGNTYYKLTDKNGYSVMSGDKKDWAKSIADLKVKIYNEFNQ